MDWAKAKRFVIFLLVALNGILFLLNEKKDKQYVISKQEEEAIFQVLSKNGIGMYTEIPKEYFPQKQMYVQVQPVEADRLRRAFFTADEEVKLTVEFQNTIIKNENKSLRIAGNSFTFSCDGGLSPTTVFSKEEAEKEADALLQKLGSSYASFRLNSRVDLENGGYRFQYYEIYKGNKVFCNTAEIDVYSEGIRTVTAVKYKIEGFFDNKMDICPANEALFTFLKTAVKQGRENVFIDKIEIGYDFQEKLQAEENRKIKLVPSYRIYVAGDKKPYSINAITNELLDAPAVEEKA